MDILSEILSLPAGDFEVQETFDFLVVKGLHKAPTTLGLKTLLKSMWQQQVSKDSIPFVIRVTLTRGADKEVISIQSDGTPSYPRKIFGDDLFDCADCKRFIGAFKAISVGNDVVRAYTNAIEFFDHLGQCEYREAEAHVTIEIEKSTIAKSIVSQNMIPPQVGISIWLRRSNFRNSFRQLGILEFYQMFLVPAGRVWFFAVVDLDRKQTSHLRSLSLVTLDQLASVISLSLSSIENRSQTLSNEQDAMTREVNSRSGLVSPTLFLKYENGSDQAQMFDCLGHIAAFSLLAFLSDQVGFENNDKTIVLSSKLPSGKIETRVELFVEENSVRVVQNGKPEKSIGLSTLALNLTDICSTFGESLGAQVFVSLRKKTVHDLLRERKYSDAIDVIIQPNALLEYYTYQKEQLLNTRLDQLAEIFEKLWGASNQVSRDLLDILENMHREVEASSTLIFGTLAFQAYLFASQAITTSQLHGLLFVFSSGLAFFVLFTHFRISGMADNADLAMRSLRNVERQVVTHTGLEVSSDWKEAPELSYSNLSSRIDTVETLTLAFLVANNAALVYLSHALFVSGLNWLQGTLAGPTLLVAFVIALTYVRRDRKGWNKLRARTRLGTIFLVLSILVLLGDAIYSVYSFSPEIATALRTMSH